MKLSSSVAADSLVPTSYPILSYTNKVKNSKHKSEKKNNVLLNGYISYSYHM